MKLRNKKTGKVLRVGEDVYIRSLDSGSIEVREDFGCGNKIEYFKTFAKMFERYEEIKEPLIKDEKIRKTVRAWAEANSIKEIIVFDCGNNAPYTPVGAVDFAENGSHLEIRFRTEERFDTDRIYTIEELCGEEKTCEN